MKVNFGFWSFSSHLKNKVIPSIRQNKNINPKKILTSKNIIINNRFLKNTKVIKDKKKFLEDQDIKIVYISSISKNHFKNSKDVIKPQFAVQKLYELTKAQDVFTVILNLFDTKFILT